MTFDYSILQKNLHDLRVENRISQADLAKELGFSRHTYLNYETGIRIPTLDAIRHISAYYQISIDDLLQKTNRNSKKSTEPSVYQKVLCLFYSSSAIRPSFNARVQYSCRSSYWALSQVWI